jgi:TadE-like protein
MRTLFTLHAPHSACGAVMVETALTLPMLLVIFFAAVQLGQALALHRNVLSVVRNLEINAMRQCQTLSDAPAPAAPGSIRQACLESLGQALFNSASAGIPQLGISIVMYRATSGTCIKDSEANFGGMSTRLDYSSPELNTLCNAPNGLLTVESNAPTSQTFQALSSITHLNVGEVYAVNVL